MEGSSRNDNNMFCYFRLPLIEGLGYSHSFYREQPGIQDLVLPGTSNSPVIFNYIVKSYCYIWNVVFGPNHIDTL